MEQFNIVWQSVQQSVSSFSVELGQFLPKLIGAILILVIGWLIAKLLLFVVVRGLKAINFGVITDKVGLDGFLKKGGVKKSTIEVLGLLIYWLVILVTLMATFNSVGLTVVSEMFRSVALFIPNVIVAVLILTIGLYAARFVSDAITTYSRNVGSEDSELIGRVTHYAISIFVVIVALSQVQIGGDYLLGLVQILWAGIVLALALAFGFGGQKWAGEQIEKFFKNKK